MIKNLGYYVIPAIFARENINDWHQVETTKIIDDFYARVLELKLDVNLDYGEDWQEEEGTIDLQLDIEGEFRDCTGNWYISWESNGKYRLIWFAGYDEKNEYKSWEWK